MGAFCDLRGAFCIWNLASHSLNLASLNLVSCIVKIEPCVLFLMSSSKPLASCNLQIASCNLQIATRILPFASCILQRQNWNLRLPTRKLHIASYCITLHIIIIIIITLLVMSHGCWSCSCCSRCKSWYCSLRYLFGWKQDREKASDGVCGEGKIFFLFMWQSLTDKSLNECKNDPLRYERNLCRGARTWNPTKFRPWLFEVWVETTVHSRPRDCLPVGIFLVFS